MASLTATCSNCGNQFSIIDQEQDFLRQKSLQSPTECPRCRQTRRLAIRGGRQLYKTTCQKCGREIVVAFDPTTVKNTILCKQDFEQYLVENDPITHDPLPEV